MHRVHACHHGDVCQVLLTEHDKGFNSPRQIRFCTALTARREVHEVLMPKSSADATSLIGWPTRRKDAATAAAKLRLLATTEVLDDIFNQLFVEIPKLAQ